jgi:glutamate/tyrosine decarboxylase-like PLP-dependent enzyme
VAEDPTLRRAHDLAQAFLAAVDERPVRARADLETLRTGFGGVMPERGEEPIAVAEWLAAAADPGLVATAGPRYFGFVVGGSTPAAIGADWLTSAWDQNAGLYALSPAAAVAEEVAGAWLVDLFGLPPDASFGFTTGATMANFTALASGRDAVLRARGWDVEEDGLFGAPPIDVVVGEEAHVTIFASLQMLGLGRSRVYRIATDGQGRMKADELRTTLAALDGPRSPARDRRAGARARWLAPCRRRVRPMGRRGAVAALPHDRARARRLVDDRFPQVA